MKIETSQRDDHQVKIVAEFEPEVMDTFKRRAARQISQKARIPGFRPGKAPYDVVRRLYGEETIEKEAIEIMLDEVYPDIIKESGIQAGGPGNLEEIVSKNPPAFAFVVPLQPTVSLGEYRTIRAEYQAPVTTDDQVDQVVRNVRANYSTAEPVERSVQEGDLVSIKISGNLPHPVEGEDAEVFKERSSQMIVGENEFEMDNWPYQGFSRELVGLSANEHKTVVYTYPEDYDDEKLRGKEVQFEVAVEDVKSLTLPELNDAFAQTVGSFDTVELMRESIRKNLTDTSVQDYDNAYFNNLIDQIVEISNLHYPPQVLQDEVDRVMHSLQHDLEDRKMDLPTYLKTLDKDEAAFIDEDIKPVAKKRLERTLVMDELARAEQIKLDSEELQREVTGLLNMYRTDPEFKKLKGAQAQNFVQNLTLDTASRILNRLVMARLKAIATGQADIVQETVPEDSTAFNAIEESPVSETSLAAETTSNMQVETPALEEESSAEPGTSPE